MKKRVICGCAIGVVVLAVLFISFKWDAIFQKGNPAPYLIAMTKLSNGNTYVAVEGKDNIYISLNGECPELFEYYKKENNLEYVEQAGSGYLFTNGTENFVISSEVYWGKYKVWTLEDTGIDEVTKNKLIYGATYDSNSENSIIVFDEVVESVFNSSGGTTQSAALLSAEIKVLEVVEGDVTIVKVEALGDSGDEIAAGDIISIRSDFSEVIEVLKDYQPNNKFKIYFPYINKSEEGIAVNCFDAIRIED